MYPEFRISPSPPSREGGWGPSGPFIALGSLGPLHLWVAFGHSLQTEAEVIQNELDGPIDGIQDSPIPGLVKVGLT